MAWILPDRDVVIFDVETTDLSVAEACNVQPEIVEIGAVHVASDLSVLDTYSTLVRPKNLESVTAFTRELTGISQVMLEDAPPFSEVWKPWCEFTQYRSRRLCAWNAPFDVSVLSAAYRGLGLSYPHAGICVDAASVVWAHACVWGFSIPNWSLARACERFEVKRSVRHRALPDAQAVVEVFRAVSEL